ncbi:4-hydroxybenzoate 3-monooxygenase [Fodinicola acaciae]|uniref:4-hydroxybenzoate 3-monooxygenase n=1 Tax=Fodinicola acaciae TaxID=2681555 RepID=UPI0013D7A266|nr:4-hydroxybenzoate 3-monooxygenase [Fodinicola acaciae]
MRTQVGIVGAGPAGLLLSHLLHLAGIESVVLEARNRAYVEQRVRAGVLEHPTAELLREVGVGERMTREGLPHEGLVLRFDGADHRMPLAELTGKTITVYGQQEVVKDLIARRLADGGRILFESTDVCLHDLTTDRPRITFVDAEGKVRQLDCDVIAGCDGFHGVSRPSIPADKLRVFQRTYPFAWLGILARTPPSHEELIYTYSERGFALHSMRSPELTRLYIQVSPEEQLADWPDERIWDELHARLRLGNGFSLHEGPVVDKLLAAMRSFVVEPMRYGRLFLAGDAAHIVPPTGAKGMNLAVADVRLLARALTELLTKANADLADAYSESCLRRVWRAEHFSWWMTSMLHRFPEDDPFAQRLQLSQLRYTTSSTAAATSMAENYVGLPFD